MAILGADQIARADDDMEIIDLDAPVVDLNDLAAKDAAGAYDEYPEPTMPENPYGNLSLDDIVRTGTLDGVNKPKTPEEQEVLDAIINFHTYTEATKDIDASFDSLMNDLKMDDLGAMMESFREEMEAELMASEMANGSYFKIRN